MRRVHTILAVAVLVVLAGCAGGGSTNGAPAVGDGGDGAMASGGGDGGAGGVSGGDSGEQVGVSVGGAQDANAFRSNVEEGYVPQPTDMTYEGLFHDYYFDTGSSSCEARFCPSYSAAVTRDPVANTTERFVTVGLNSGLTESDLERDALNLVVVVDTSGSMDEAFSEYYYDGGERKEVEENGRKMEAARESVVTMLGHLDGEDRVAVVGYDDRARVVQDLTRVDEANRADLRSSVRDLSAGGGTNLDSGIDTAHDLLSEASGERETRVVYVTDAMPNLGETGASALEERLQEHAKDEIYTSFVGVGVDFNSRLTKTLATIKGANYYSVHSPAQFEERMDEGFSYMVTPLAFNLSLSVQSEGYEIEQVYGSPQADRASGQLMEVKTLFPSRRENNRTEGGVVLLEVERESPDARLALQASYENPGEGERTVTRTVGELDREAPYYGTTGVRKAVVLSEYATLMQNWAAHERTDDGEAPAATEPIEHQTYDSQWEQSSVPLQVTAPYDERITRFLPYYRSHMDALSAERMEEDLAILQALADHARASSTTGDDAESATSDDAESTTGDQPTGDQTTDPQASDVPTTDAGTAAGLLGNPGSVVGLVNLGLTLLVGAYGIGQKRRSRNRVDER